MHLPRHALREPLDGKLAGMVVGMARERTEPGKRRHVEDDPSPARVGRLTHGFEGPRRDPRRAKEERLHLAVRLLLGRRLGVAREGVAGVVDDDVDVELAVGAAAKVLGSRGGGKRGVNRAWGGYVQGQLEDVRVAIGQVREIGRVAGRGDQTLPGLAGDEGREGAPNAGRASSDWTGARGFSESSYWTLTGWATHSTRQHRQEAYKGWGWPGSFLAWGSPLVCLVGSDVTEPQTAFWGASKVVDILLETAHLEGLVSIDGHLAHPTILLRR